MRIAIDARPLTWPRSGVAYYTANLVRALARIDHINEYHLLAQHPAPRPEAENWFIHAVESPIWLQWAVPRLVSRLGIHVFHGTNYTAPVVSRAPSVVTVHDLSLLLYPQYHSWRNRLLTGWQMRACIHRLPRVIADSEATKGDIVRFLGLPPERVTVILLAADERFRPVADEALRASVLGRYRLPPSFILFVGNIEPRKNLGVLLNSYSELVSHGDAGDTALVLAGHRAADYGRLARLADALGIGGRVHFPGRVVDEDLPALYSAARLVAYPSIYEGFGLPVLQAMACGTPVVCSNSSSLPEVAGDAAIAVDAHSAHELAHAMLQLLHDPSLRQEMIARGLARSAGFSWEQTARRTLAVYEELGGC